MQNRRIRHQGNRMGLITADGIAMHFLIQTAARVDDCWESQRGEGVVVMWLY